MSLVGGSSFICSLVHSQWGYLKYSWNYLWWDFNLKMFYCRFVVFHTNCFCYFCDTQKTIYSRYLGIYHTHTQTLVFFFFLTHLIRAQKKTKYQNELSLQMYFFILLYIFISFFLFPFTSFHFLSFHTLYFLCFFSFFTSSFILFFFILTI